MIRNCPQATYKLYLTQCYNGQYILNVLWKALMSATNDPSSNDAKRINSHQFGLQAFPHVCKAKITGINNYWSTTKESEAETNQINHNMRKILKSKTFNIRTLSYPMVWSSNISTRFDLYGTIWPDHLWVWLAYMIDENLWMKSLGWLFVTWSKHLRFYLT